MFFNVRTLSLFAHSKVLICYNSKNPYKDESEWMKMTESVKPVKGNKWKQRVYNWLAEEGMFRKEVEDPKATYHFRVNYPLGSPHHIEVIKPRDMKDGILVMSILRIAPPHVTALAKLADEKRKPIVHKLRLQLLQRRPGFSVKEDDGVWEAVQFQARLFYDNLTKSTLMTALDDVFRSILTVIWTLGHHFGIPSGQKPQPGFYT
jgi:hypothetical protein